MHFTCSTFFGIVVVIWEALGPELEGAIKKVQGFEVTFFVQFFGQLGCRVSSLKLAWFYQ